MQLKAAHKTNALKKQIQQLSYDRAYPRPQTSLLAPTAAP